jgi:hypothetical protein
MGKCDEIVPRGTLAIDKLYKIWYRDSTTCSVWIKLEFKLIIVSVFCGSYVRKYVSIYFLT